MTDRWVLVYLTFNKISKTRNYNENTCATYCELILLSFVFFDFQAALCHRLSSKDSIHAIYGSPKLDKESIKWAGTFKTKKKLVSREGFAFRFAFFTPPQGAQLRKSSKHRGATNKYIRVNSTVFPAFPGCFRREERNSTKIRE